MPDAVVNTACFYSAVELLCAEGRREVLLEAAFLNGSIVASLQYSRADFRRF
jgi:hypothetical protein